MRHFISLSIFALACGSAAHTPDAGGMDAGEVGTDSGSQTVPCGSTTCTAEQVCCVDCDGVGTCGAPGSACAGTPCFPDAGSSADAGSSTDAGSAACSPGTCRITADGPCEEPSGPVGNGCCGCGQDGMCNNPCRCAAPDTRIATPDGERAIASLAVGDLVFSVDRGALVAVPIAMIHRAPVIDHQVMRVRLANGRTLSMSPGHPTGDGRALRDLIAGDAIDGVSIESIELAQYEHDATYDIRPASDTATYVAEGVLVGSTLRDLLPSTR